MTPADQELAIVIGGVLFAVVVLAATYCFIIAKNEADKK